MTQVSPLFPTASISPLIPNTVGVQVLGKLDETIKQSGQYEKITDLVLDQIQFSSFTTQVHQMLSRCRKLTYLSMQFCELESLENMIIFLNLQKLQLGYNKLTDKDLTILSSISTLRSLTLTKNNIQKLQSLTILSTLPNLTNLILTDNPVTKVPDYRNKVFQILPKLLVLDGKDCDNQSVRSQSKDNEGDEDEDSYDQQNDDDEENQESDNQEPEMRKVRKLEQ